MSASFAFPSMGGTLSRTLVTMLPRRSVCCSRFSCLALGMTEMWRSMSDLRFQNKSRHPECKRRIQDVGIFLSKKYKAWILRLSPQDDVFCYFVSNVVINCCFLLSRTTFQSITPVQNNEIWSMKLVRNGLFHTFSVSALGL